MMEESVAQDTVREIIVKMEGLEPERFQFSSTHRENSFNLSNEIVITMQFFMPRKMVSERIGINKYLQDYIG